MYDDKSEKIVNFKVNVKRCIHVTNVGQREKLDEAHVKLFSVLRNTKMLVSSWTCCALMNAEPNFRKDFSRGMSTKIAQRRSLSALTATTGTLGRIERFELHEVKNVHEGAHEV